MSAIAFLDESADESGKLDQGASRLFVVGLVIFSDPEEAARRRERIDQLRGDLGRHGRYEFHFRNNPDLLRRAFLTAVAPFASTYHAVTIEKHTPVRAAHLPLYLDACARVCALAGSALEPALLVDAGAKDKTARHAAAATLRQRINGEAGRVVLSEVRAQDSARNNLVQLADYVTGVRRWLEDGRRGADIHARLLRQREGQFLRERR